MGVGRGTAAQRPVEGQSKLCSKISVTNLGSCVWSIYSSAEALYLLVVNCRGLLAIRCTCWERCDLVLEKLVGLLPDTDVPPVIEANQAGEQSGTERLGCLSWEKRWQVVDANDTQWEVIGFRGELNGDSRLVESGVDVVDRDRVVRVGGVARHITNNTQLAAG